MVKFSDQKCSVCRCTFVMQPRQYQSIVAQLAEHTKCAKKGKRKWRERDRERERTKKCRNKSQKKTNKKNSSMRIHFPIVIPAPWPFVSVKFWQCLIVKNNILSSNLFLISCLCWIPTLPRFWLHFSKPRPFKDI